MPLHLFTSHLSKMGRPMLKCSIGWLLATVAFMSGTPSDARAAFVEEDGLVVIEMESTDSDLGAWKLIPIDTAGYPTQAQGAGHLEYPGGGTWGVPDSPLTYTFKITTPGKYHLQFRAHKRLEGEEGDQCNDCFVKMEGDFTSGDPNIPLEALQADIKLFGGAPEKWGVAQMLDINTRKFGIDKRHLRRQAVYEFKQGETYTLTVSGRSKRFNLDRLVLSHESRKVTPSALASLPESSNSDASEHETSATSKSAPDAGANSQPNILWVLTDDQRYDSIRAFNKMLHDREMSELGYVESPQVDRLAKMGTTFVNTYCHAPGCAPSRASMHFGRYPFRSGVYEFEYHNNSAEHCRPTLPEQMVGLGYQTFHVGKLGVRLKTVRNGKVRPHAIYQQDVSFKQMHKDGLTDWGKDWFTEINGVPLDPPVKELRFFVPPDGRFEYASLELEKRMPQYAGSAQATMQKYDLLRHYGEGEAMQPDDGSVLAGVSPQPAGKTRDGWYTEVLRQFLQKENGEFAVGSQSVEGVDPSKPLFCHLGFDFPHTPVLPPAKHRDRFHQHTYEVPQVTEAEMNAMPSQLRRMVKEAHTDHFSDAEKQAMIQDYFAFCAYGDSLVGQAVDDFVEYSTQHDQPWMVVYVCGDHGWKLNDHGACSKFTPWEVDTHNPIIVISSNRTAFPPGKVVKGFTEFVDIAPTCLAAGGAKLDESQFEYLDGYDLAAVASGEAPSRDYVIGESHAVTGPRAFIRTKEYVFSMQSRPNKKRGQNMDWAINATWKQLDPALYHTPTDPHETNNLASSPDHQQVARTLQQKLLQIVLGDNRVEVDWGPRADGTQVFRSNFAPGADDKTLPPLASNL